MVYVDEAACYLLPLVAPTWAPKGQTPVLREACSYQRLNLMSAITPTGKLYVAGQDVPYNGVDVAGFLHYLSRRFRGRKLLVIWDGASIHRAQAVKDFLESHPERVHLEVLPPYSPELNADEMVWSHLKRSLKNQVFTDLESLQQAVLEQVKQMQNNPALIRSFFRKKEIGFFTN